jgi:hypothetical protein
MSYVEAETVQMGVAAWRRLQQSERTAWSDWVRVGHALLILRRDSMLDAKANTPFGMRYVKVFSAALKANGLDAVNGQDRYKIIQCLEHEVEIEQWRAGLDEKQRLRLNHPSAVWMHFTKAFRPGRQVEPRPRNTTGKVHKAHKGRPNFWSQDTLRRAAEGIRAANSHDIFIVARAVLDGAFPTKDALIEAANEPRPNQSHSRRTAADAELHAEA